MNKLIFFLGILFTFFFWGVNSCDKPEPSHTLPVLTDTCDACDKMKEIIKTDPDFKNYQNYLDSLYCFYDDFSKSYICNFKSNFSTSPDLSSNYNYYDEKYWLSALYSEKYGTIDSRYNQADPNAKRYSHIYYSYSPRDTPYLAPITIWCDFNESKPYNTPISGATVEVCLYFNTSAQRYTHNYDVSFQGARQLGDTIRLIAPSKKITDYKVSSKDYIQYYCIYKIIVSPDRESAELQVEFYDNNSPRKLVKRIEGYALKRWHK